MKLKQVMIQAACAAVALGTATVAFAIGQQQNPNPATPVVVGGGASLPEFLYSSEITAFGPNHIYAVTGSGIGKGSLLNNNPNYTNVAGGDTFNNVYKIARGDTVVHYAGSDSILSDSEINTYNSTRQASEGNLVQIPSVGTAVGIAFKNAAVSSLTLSTDQLCGVFSGKYTNFNQIGGPSAPITVVFRSDSSGTSEIFTRHLNKVCTTGAGGNSNVAFVTSTKFTDSFPGGVPANFVGANLSAGVRDAIATNSGVGYLSPDYINTTLAPSSTVATQNLSAASLTNRNNSTSYQPTWANTTLALGSLSPLGADLSNPKSWALTAADPASGYPIAGLTYLDHVQCYSNATVQSQILAFLDRHTTYSGVNDNRPLIRNNGFAPLPTSLVSSIRSNLINSSASTGIGNTTACAGKAGR